MNGVGKLPGTGGNEALDGVGQRVQTGGYLQRTRHAVHQVRVNDREDRDVVLVDAHELALVLGVGDDVVDGGLRRGTGGGRNANDRHGRLLGVGHALQGENVRELGICANNANCLRGVLRRTAANADEDVRTFVVERLDARLHVLHGRIGDDVGEDGVGEFGGFELVGQLGQNA